MCFLETVIHCLQADVGYRQFPFEVACVRELEFACTLDPRFRSLRKRRLNPGTTLLIKPAAYNTGFRPSQQPKRSEGSTGIKVKILSIQFHEYNVGVEFVTLHHLRN